MARTVPAYCEEGDLLIGDIALGPAYSKTEYIDTAADEIDSRIGVRYALPLPALATLNEVSRLILKRINAHLASGRLILAVATAGQDDSLHAYGKYLVDEAVSDILMIQNGQIDLEDVNGDSLPEASLTGVDDGPTVKNVDEQSGVDTFYSEFGFGSVWAPGAKS